VLLFGVLGDLTAVCGSANIDRCLGWVPMPEAWPIFMYVFGLREYSLVWIPLPEAWLIFVCMLGIVEIDVIDDGGIPSPRCLTGVCMIDTIESWGSKPLP
jgi:hypothetical protein